VQAQSNVTEKKPGHLANRRGINNKLVSVNDQVTTNRAKNLWVTLSLSTQAIYVIHSAQPITP
jgi:hypothetical protein